MKTTVEEALKLLKLLPPKTEIEITLPSLPKIPNQDSDWPPGTGREGQWGDH